MCLKGIQVTIIIKSSALKWPSFAITIEPQKYLVESAETNCKHTLGKYELFPVRSYEIPELPISAKDVYQGCLVSENPIKSNPPIFSELDVDFSSQRKKVQVIKNLIKKTVLSNNLQVKI